MERDPDLDAARQVYNRACWEVMNSHRKTGVIDESWMAVADAIIAKWPTVDPLATPHREEG